MMPARHRVVVATRGGHGQLAPFIPGAWPRICKLALVGFLDSLVIDTAIMTARTDRRPRSSDCG